MEWPKPEDQNIIYLFGSKARTKYLVGRTNKWVANPPDLTRPKANKCTTKECPKKPCFYL